VVWCAASIVSFSELLTTLDTGVSKVNENEIHAVKLYENGFMSQALAFGGG
jgi:hypothetical protein